MLREVNSSYGATPGGYLWAVVEPVASITLLSIVFSLAFRHPPLGVNFPMFYATGMLPFLMFTTLSNKVAMAIRYSKPLLTYPAVTYLDALVARFLLAFATNLVVSAVIFFGLYFVFDTRTNPQIPGMFLAMVMAASLGLGVGMANAFLFSMYDSWASIWSILTRPLVIVSGVLVPYTAIPQPFRDFLWYNPILQVVGQVRGSVYVNYDDDYVSLAYVFGVSAALLVIGLMLLSRYHRLLLND